MISLKTPTKSPILPNLNADQRYRLIEFIADRYLDSMGGRDLERFFLDVQRDYLQEYNDDELIGAMEDITNEDEYTEILEDLAK